MFIPPAIKRASKRPLSRLMPEIKFRMSGFTGDRFVFPVPLTPFSKFCEEGAERNHRSKKNRKGNMENQNNEIMKKLEKLAHQKSKAFCYTCYKTAPTGTCQSCFSDDLMRETKNGVEYGYDWIIKDLIEEHCTPINEDEEFESSIEGCYPETVTVLWMELDAITVAKEADPISWRIAKEEWINQEIEEGQIIEFNSKYYRTYEVEEFIEKELS